MSGCRHCGVELPAELAFMGICAWCVAATMQAPPLRIPRPRYGDDGEDDEDPEEQPDLAD